MLLVCSKFLAIYFRFPMVLTVFTLQFPLSFASLKLGDSQARRLELVLSEVSQRRQLGEA